jgi:ankyrin repeat protein
LNFFAGIPNTSSIIHALIDKMKEKNCLSGCLSNPVTSTRQTPLEAAIQTANLDNIYLLVKAITAEGTDNDISNTLLNRKDSSGETALDYMNFLIKKYENGTDSKSQWVCKICPAIKQMLTENGGKTGGDLNEQLEDWGAASDRQQIKMQKAEEQSRAEMAKLEIENAEKGMLQEEKNAAEFERLILGFNGINSSDNKDAAKKQKGVEIDRMIELLDAGIGDVNKIQSNGHRPLHNAIEVGHAMKIKQVGDPTKRNKEIVIGYIDETKYLQLVKKIIAKEADVNAEGVLGIAAYRGEEKVVDELLKHSSINIKELPLSSAFLQPNIIGKFLDKLKQLPEDERNEILKAKNSEGRTILHEAVLMRLKERAMPGVNKLFDSKQHRALDQTLEKFLIEININTLDSKGETILDYVDNFPQQHLKMLLNPIEREKGAFDGIANGLFNQEQKNLLLEKKYLAPFREKLVKKGAKTSAELRK